MKAYQAAQQKYKTDIQNKMKRQVKVVKPDATDEEVDEIMRSEGGRDALYKQTILAGGVNDEITWVLVKIWSIWTQAQSTVRNSWYAICSFNTQNCHC